MKFTVDLEDFYMDEDSGSIEKELKDHIINGVTCQIQKNIEKKIDEEITRVVKQHVENVLLKKISGKVAELIEVAEVTVSGKKVPLQEYICTQFENSSGWRSPYEDVKNIARQWGEELKIRYDKAFAVHIVDVMKQNGLLKDEAIAKLLA